MARLNVSRRKFIKMAAVGAAGTVLAACSPSAAPVPAAPPAQAPKATEAIKAIPTSVPPTQAPAAKAAEPAKDQELRLVGFAGTNDRYTSMPFMTVHAGAGVNRIFLYDVWGGLLRINPATLGVEPDIAEKWEVDSAGTTYTFSLRKNVKFSDGTPVTAKHIKYGLELTAMLGHPKYVDDYPLPSLAYLLIYDVPGVRQALDAKIDYNPTKGCPLDSVQIPDDYTIKITIEKPSSTFLARIACGAASAIKPENVATNTKENPWYLKPITSGPYMVQTFTPDKEIVLVPNPNYYGEKPKLQKITIKPVADFQTQIAMYQNNELDFVGLRYPEVAEFMKKEHPQNKELVMIQSSIVNHFWITKYPPFDDVNFRRALSMATDRELLCNVLLPGFFIPANSYVPPVFKECDFSKTKMFKFDPVAAKEELKKSKYAGQPIEFTLRTTTTDTTKQLLDVLKAEWEKHLGVKVKLVVVDGNLGNPPEIWHIWRNSQPVKYPHPDSSLRNVASFIRAKPSSDKDALTLPQVTELLDKLDDAARITDPAKSCAAYQEVVQMWNDQVLTLVTFYQMQPALIKPWVKGLSVNPASEFVNLRSTEILAH